MAGYGSMGALSTRNDDPRTAIVLADIVTTLEVALPLTSVWVHEEFHRVAMGRRGVDSHNDVYDFNLSADWIAVSHLEDAELARTINNANMLCIAAKSGIELKTTADIDMGTARWHEAICLRTHGEPCTMCVDHCPVGSVALELVGNASYTAELSEALAVQAVTAIEAARKLVERVPPDVARAVPAVEPLVPFSHLTLATFGRWDEVLAEPKQLLA